MGELLPIKIVDGLTISVSKRDNGVEEITCTNASNIYEVTFRGIIGVDENNYLKYDIINPYAANPYMLFRIAKRDNNTILVATKDMENFFLVRHGQLISSDKIIFNFVLTKFAVEMTKVIINSGLPLYSVKDTMHYDYDLPNPPHL